MAPPQTNPANEDLADVVRLIERMRNGERRAISHAVTELERLSAAAPALLQAMQPHLGHALVVGFTGSPGAGKSTLVNAYTRYVRSQSKTVGIIAVDPSSPVSGGAILGDRIRMTATLDDDGVFMRSLASRGHLGGLSPAAVRVIDALDAAGKDIVLIETVGTGQSEIDVAEVADVRVLVTAPGLGDDIQAMKAGLIEIADILVVNKADREGADRSVRDLQMMQGLAAEHGDWVAPILKTVGAKGEGIAELAEAADRHLAWLRESGELQARRRAHLRLRVETILKERVVREADQVLGLDREVERGFASRTDPYRVADRLFEGVVRREAEERRT
jgi:LAO/AO transport system kinase